MRIFENVRFSLNEVLYLFYLFLYFWPSFIDRSNEKGMQIFILEDPSITDGVHHNENFVEIIPVFSTFSNFFKKKKKL